MYYYYDRPKKKKPRKVEGGIRAKSRRGEIGQSELSKMWIDSQALGIYDEDFRKGKSYARSGQVLSVKLSPGRITGTVQGTKKRPYEIVMTFNPISDKYWQRFMGWFRVRPALAVKLLAGEMPKDALDMLMTKQGVIYPSTTYESIECHCGQIYGICKHVAALIFIIAEEFDRDPFQYLKVLGLSREKFLSMIISSSQGSTYQVPSPALTAVKQSYAKDDSDGLTANLEGQIRDFWGQTQTYPDEQVDISETDAGLLKALGDFPMWAGEEEFTSTMEPIYDAACFKAARVYLGWRT